MGAVALFSCVLWATVATGDALAQPRTSAAVLQTATSASDADLATAVTRTLRAALSEISSVDVSASTSIPLSELQFALGCLNESEQCLAQIALQLEVKSLLLSSIDMIDDSYVLEVAFFQRDTGETRRASRRTSGPGARSDLLGDAEALVYEVLELSPPSTAATEVASEEHGTGPKAAVGRAVAARASEDEPVRTAEGEPARANEAEPRPMASGKSPAAQDQSGASAADRFLRALPYVVAGTGLAVLGTGIGFGVRSQRTEDDFRSSPVGTVGEIEAARSTLDSARRQATLGNALMAAGAALIGAGAVLFFTVGDHEKEPAAAIALTPTGSFSSAGMRMTVRYGGTP